MISTRQFVLVFGIVYIAVGVLGFVPGLNQPPPAGAPTLVVSSFYAFLLSLFAINVLHNLFHIVVGAIGVAVQGSAHNARLYCRALAVVFAALTVFGLLAMLNTTFGLIPLFGLDVALHAVTGLALAYFACWHRHRPSRPPPPPAAPPSPARRGLAVHRSRVHAVRAITLDAQADDAPGPDAEHLRVETVADAVATGVQHLGHTTHFDHPRPGIGASPGRPAGGRRQTASAAIDREHWRSTAQPEARPAARHPPAGAAPERH
ncbi:MAG: DUF4383 domain-containing protein [Chloroflexi bacterium]|nr:DUF4383 domain-containing protein [Chloroflexota bacterium]